MTAGLGVYISKGSPVFYPDGRPRVVTHGRLWMIQLERRRLFGLIKTHHNCCPDCFGTFLDREGVPLQVTYCFSCNAIVHQHCTNGHARATCFDCLLPDGDA